MGETGPTVLGGTVTPQKVESSVRLPLGQATPLSPVRQPLKRKRTLFLLHD